MAEKIIYQCNMEFLPTQTLKYFLTKDDILKLIQEVNSVVYHMINLF